MNARFGRSAVAGVTLALALLCTILLLWPQTAAAQDGAPATPVQPAVLHREPGHLVGVKDLDVRVAEGTVSDPLGANSTLIYWDKISMVFHGTDNKFTRKTYDVDANLGAPIAKQRWGSLAVNGAGNMSIAAGYLGGTAGWIDTAAAWEYPAGYVSVYVASYNSSLGLNVDRTLNTSDQVQGGAISGWPPYGGLIRVATGDFDGDGYDEFVVVWEGASKSLNVRTYDTNGGFEITAKGKIADEVLGGYKPLGVAAGDFDADGKDEIAVAWEGGDGKLAVKVYSVASDGSLVAEVKLVEAITPGLISVAAGDFDGDAIDEFAVAFNTQSNTNLYLYQATNNLHTLTRRAAASPPSGVAGNSTIVELAGRQLGIGAGDFNADGKDELAMAYGAPTKWYCNVAIYSADATFTLAAKATLLSNWLTAYGDLSLAVGDLNRDSIAEIAAGSVFGAQLGSNDVDLGLFQVTPDLGTITQKGHIQDEFVGQTGYNFGHVAIAVGAFDGKSVRIGAPVYSQLVDTQQIIAVINAPPKHTDVIGGETYDVNVTDRCTAPVGPPCTYAKYETATKATTSMQVSTNRDWSVSADAELKFPHVKTSLEASYGESFEKTTTSFQSKEFGQDVEADTDDVIVRLQQTLNIWEYPVYADGSDAIQGHILVTWPEKTDPACSSNCTAAITARIDAKNPLSRFSPNHEFGNVLSYSVQPPTDVSTTVKSDVMTYMGSNAYQMWTAWSDVQESETKQSSKLDLKASLEVSGFGQSLTTSGSYAQGETTVNKVSFEQSTSIHLYFFGIEQKYSYGVRPIIYWSNPDGRLVLDYAVQPLTASPPTPSTWWQKTYTMADLTFNLPWKDGEQGEEYTDLTREITFSPESASAGDIVAITAKVRNYSLVGANNVLVRFCLGEPEPICNNIGEKTIPILNPMSAATAAIQFNTAGQTPGATLKIYAVVDPGHGIPEMHEENNVAYAQLPIVSSIAGVGGPRSLSIVADDIVVEPPAPVAGETVYISATIHAANAAFTWVGVEFWDGNPVFGGRLIGGRLVPLVDPAGATVGVEVPEARSVGPRDIWVTIARHPDDQVTTDNSAHKVVELAPYPSQLYLPEISK